MAEQEVVEQPEETPEAEPKAEPARKAKAKPKCDNHPDQVASLVTDRDGRIGEQHFCDVCAAGLPEGY